MLKLKIVGLLLCLTFLALSACASSPSGASPADAQAAAQGALGRLDGQAGNPTDVPGAPSPTQIGGQNVPSSPSSQQKAVKAGGNKPAWVDSVESVYDRVRFVAAVGYASGREMAEKNALANLTAIFGQSIKADQTITNAYQEAVKSGVTAGWTDSIDMQNTIKTTTSMDTLIGAEIKEVWQDTRNNVFYAVAVMEKIKTIQLYNDMINANQNLINNLIKMNQTEKNSLEGFSRYQLAAVAADINISYGNVLKVLDAPVPATLVKGDNYRLEAQNISKAIPVGIIVKNDKAGRIQGAFAKALSDIGFRSGGNNSRYILNVNVSVSPVDLPNNTNKFARMELSADLTDTTTKAVILPYNFINREGHNTAAEAENRTFTAAERKIGEEYKDIFFTYLSQLLPKK